MKIKLATAAAQPGTGWGFGSWSLGRLSIFQHSGMSFQTQLHAVFARPPLSASVCGPGHWCVTRTCPGVLRDIAEGRLVSVCVSCVTVRSQWEESGLDWTLGYAYLLPAIPHTHRGTMHILLCLDSALIPNIVRNQFTMGKKKCKTRPCPEIH